MVQATQTPSADRVAIVAWTARMGAITAEALAARQDTSVRRPVHGCSARNVAACSAARAR